MRSRFLQFVCGAKEWNAQKIQKMTNTDAFTFIQFVCGAHITKTEQNARKNKL